MATETLPATMTTENLEQQQPPPTKRIITQEDVLKRFMDSKAKSPPKPETRASASPKPTGGFEDSTNISKNIFHGVHIPPHLQKTGTKYFYVSNASKFEGNINEIALAASKSAAQYILSSRSTTFGSPSLCSSSDSFWDTPFINKYSQHAEADIHQESIKT